MVERYGDIGETAGKIYRSLENAGSVNLAKLQKDVKVSESALFHQALGWLGREGKINFEKSGKATSISLTGIPSY